MEYCAPNSSLSTVWANRGLAPCFLYTLTSAVQMGIMLTLGTAELSMYRRYGSRVGAALKPKSKLFSLQLTAAVLLALMPVVRLIVSVAVFHSQVFGYLLLRCLCESLAWTYALALITVERQLELPSPPARGHGVILLIFAAVCLLVDNLYLMSINSPLWYFRQDVKTLESQFYLGMFVAEYLLSFLSFALMIRAPGLPSNEERYAFHYGRLRDPESANTQSATTESHGSTFKNFWRKMRILLPFLWPKKSFLLQLRVVICVLLLIAGRIVNLYVPIYYKWIVNSLSYSAEGGTLSFEWPLIVGYVGLKLCQGGAGSGFISIILQFLWVRITQYTTLETQTQLYSHIHSLSLRWHYGKKTGEVLRIMDRGTDSITQLLYYMLFNIAPTIVDILIAVVFFIAAFNGWFGLIVFVTMVIYLVLTYVVTEWRTKFRREMNQLENDTRFKGVDALLNFETVKYYNAEEYEIHRYKEAMIKYQAAEWLSQASLSLMNAIQNGVISVGLLGGSLLCAHMVVVHENNFTVGDYVLFATYIMQLYQPLNWLGTYYRVIQRSFIDMENMFDLLKISPEVRDDPDAPDYIPRSGKIEFSHVSFHYQPEKQILKNISFVVEPGRTLALVGPSGSGKSTIVRLLFRFYDVIEGSVLFDDQDIRGVTQQSVRKTIGVVPQDTVLFNETIRYNIRYGKVTATDEEVEAAAKVAEIHEKIVTFPNGYDTVVGERGLRLSGGEKQRVAIARTVLKATKFVLLDEATSSLDTQTERNIQSTLDKMSAGRTTVMVAHRLSTIIHADEILVVKDGEVVERGRHEELVNANGVYAEMWQQQLTHKDGEESSGFGTDRDNPVNNDSVEM